MKKESIKVTGVTAVYLIVTIGTARE